ncbi:MAG TPA: efflux RND transporter periplasmic adaptor subunit [Gemmatimonadaceae bacterium]|nr:efflux RND transporter periplasmic adaptor subunit [Gemmatimonadaceae bacterium]
MPQSAPTVNVGPENLAIVEQTTLSTGPALSGQLSAEKTASIRAEVAASVLNVLHDQGARVEKGASLAKLDDTAIRDLWLSARSGVTAAQTSADQAQRELQRSERLLAAGAIAERDMEGARNSNTAAQAMLADAKARMSAAQKQLDATEVKSPFAGVVAERHVSAGDVVAPGTPLFTVVDPATMRLEAAVPAANLSEVRVGMRARFTVTGYAPTFEGRITAVNPAADPATGQVRIYATIPNTGGQLVSGLFAQGRVATETRRALAAPVNAIDQRALKPFVVRLKGGKTERVEVSIGVRDEERERVELIGGIAAGDTLLLGAAQGITAGTVVKVRRAGDVEKQQ